MRNNRKTSRRKDPLYMNKAPLLFDNITEEEELELSTSQQQDKFLSQWMELIDPFEEFPKVFNHKNNPDRILRDIKNYYKKYVIENKWTEKKYVFVINSIFEARTILAPFTIEKFGRTYEEGLLPIQVRLSRPRGAK